MKREIAAYITAMIHEREDVPRDIRTYEQKKFLKQLNTLLDFVMDIPEESDLKNYLTKEYVVPEDDIGFSTSKNVECHNKFKKILDKIKRA